MMMINELTLAVAVNGSCALCKAVNMLHFQIESLLFKRLAKITTTLIQGGY